MPKAIFYLLKWGYKRVMRLGARAASFIIQRLIQVSLSFCFLRGNCAPRKTSEEFWTVGKTCLASPDNWREHDTDPYLSV